MHSNKTLFAIRALALLFVSSVFTDDVVVLTEDNFEKEVGQDCPALVEFYAPLCGHCKKLAPEYEKLGASFKKAKSVLIAKVDCDEHKSVCGKFGVSGYPTIQWFPKGSLEPKKYEGARTSEALVEFVNKEADIEMVTGDSVVWSSIVGAFMQNSDGCEALDLFKRMKRACFGAEEATLTSVLRACTALALLELGRQVHVHSIKYGPDLILNNALLDMFCKCGSLEDANAVFTRMVEKDVTPYQSNEFIHELFVEFGSILVSLSRTLSKV